MSRHYHLVENSPGHLRRAMGRPVTADPVRALELLAGQVEAWIQANPDHPATADAEGIALPYAYVRRLESSGGFAHAIADRVFGVTSCTRPGCLDGMEDA